MFYGKIEGINDLVTFEGESVTQLKESFKDAVSDYIELCEDLIRICPPAMFYLKYPLPLSLWPSQAGQRKPTIFLFR